MGQTPDFAPVSGRGVVLVDHFYRVSGASLQALEALIRAGTLEGLTNREGAAVGLFEDSLPSAAELRALGLSASGDYRPADLLSLVELDADDEPTNADSGHRPTWSMSW